MSLFSLAMRFKKSKVKNTMVNKTTIINLPKYLNSRATTFLNLPQYLNSRAIQYPVLCLTKCEESDTDEYIARKWKTYKREAREYPEIKNTFINAKTSTCFFAYNGKIDEVKYKSEDGSITYQQLLEKTRSFYLPKEQYKFISCFNNCIQGDKYWDSIYHAEMTRVNNEIEIADMKHLPLGSWDIEKGRKLYAFLNNKGNRFISSDTPIDSFLYIMGFTDEKPTTPKRITWMKNKELLRLLLMDLMYKDSITNGHLKNSDLEKLVQECFTDKHDAPMELAKPKKLDYSQDVDLLMEFFPTIS